MIKINNIGSISIFVEERCRLGLDEKIGTVKMYDEYKKWCHAGEERALSRNKFHDQIMIKFPAVYKSVARSKGKQKRCFKGIGLKERIV